VPRIRLASVAVIVLVVGALVSAGAVGASAAETSSPRIVVGADQTGAPLVNEFDLSGALLGSFFAYDPQFSGGVRVAAGDVNGDGIADIVTAPGPGAGPHVKVFSGKDGSLLASFFAFDAGFAGGVFVAAGDLNGDGIADIVTAPGSGAGPHVKAFSGKDGSLLASFFAYDPQFTGGVRVAAGDLNGDGIADIVTAPGPGAGPHVKAFSGKDGSLLASFFAYDPQFTGGLFVAAGDVNGDGRADIITGADSSANVKVFSGKDGSLLASFFAYDPQFTGGVRVAAGDLNGDGIADVVTAPGPAGAPLVKVFAGTSITQISSFFAFDPRFTGGVYVAAPPVPTRISLVNVLLGDATGVGPGTSLSDKVLRIRGLLEEGEIRAACATLRAFTREVRAQTGKSISSNQAVALIADAANLRAAIPC
jgi:VCBS repeat protein/FG-GAP repeat protein